MGRKGRGRENEHSEGTLKKLKSTMKKIKFSGECQRMESILNMVIREVSVNKDQKGVRKRTMGLLGNTHAKALR